MAWIRSRTIHGRTYLYQERRYREGGKVCSESRYLGALDESTGELHLLIDDLIQDTPSAPWEIRRRQRGVREKAAKTIGLKQTTPVLLSEITSRLLQEKKNKEEDERQGTSQKGLEGQGETKGGIGRREGRGETKGKRNGRKKIATGKERASLRASRLSITADTTSYGFSERAMRQEYGDMVRALAFAGGDPSSLPRVIVRRSYSLRSLLSSLISSKREGASPSASKKASPSSRSSFASPSSPPSPSSPMGSSGSLVSSGRSSVPSRSSSSPSSLGIRREKRMGAYVVSLPPRIPRGKKKDIQKELKREYRRSLAFSFLENIEKQHPERFEAFSKEMKKSFSKRNEALTRYITHTGSKSAFARRLALSFGWKILHPIPTGKGSSLDPQSLALSSYGSRRVWKEDAADILGDALGVLEKERKGLSSFPSHNLLKDIGLQRLQEYHRKKCVFLRKKAETLEQERKKTGFLKRLFTPTHKKAEAQEQRLHARAELHEERFKMIKRFFLLMDD